MRGNDFMSHLTRGQRRNLLKAEARARKSGDWGPWERIDLRHGVPGRGWCREVSHAFKNKVFSVLVRSVKGGTHFSVSSLSEIRPTWWEMQRIKDELAGEDMVAVEIYPRHNDIVDGANMFHIWVCDEQVPFNLWRDEHTA